MENIKISVHGNGTTTLATAGTFCDRDIDVNVDVPDTPPVLQEKTATENGEVTADEGYDGLAKVTVDVPMGASTTYLYNDVELPALPCWDHNAYPFAYIRTYNDEYFLFVTNVRYYKGSSTICYGQGYHLIYEISDGAWSIYSAKFSHSGANAPFWSNVDIFNNDGTIYLAAGSTDDPNAPPNIGIPAIICPDKSVNYKYNDTEYPALPDYNASIYPYVVIRVSGTTPQAIISRTPQAKDTATGGSIVVYNLTNGVWTQKYTFTKGMALDGTLIWANYDIPTTDKDYTVVISKSDPIAVT